MADAKRLPVWVCWTEDCRPHFGNPICLADDPNWPGYDKYEPAVPRCKTCPKLTAPLALSAGDQLLRYCQLTWKPKTETDYCSEHPEARR